MAAVPIAACGGDDGTSSTTTAALVGVSPTELTGNVVWGFDAAADESPDDQQAVEACLPI